MMNYDMPGSVLLDSRTIHKWVRQNAHREEVRIQNDKCDFNTHICIDIVEFWWRDD